MPSGGAEAMSNNPFAALLDAREQVPDGDPVAERPEEPPSSEDADGVSFDGKLVVRREKKGRGGKTATVIEGLRGAPEDLDAIAQGLRKELGCGAHMEGDRVVVGGAHVDRLCDWLRGRGAKRVVAGN